MALIISAGCDSEHDDNPPNFVLIQMDDLGYDDLGLHGHPVLETPHLDKLGGQSMRLEQFGMSRRASE